MDFPRPSMSASELFGDLKDKLGFGGGRSDRRDDYYDDPYYDDYADPEPAQGPYDSGYDPDTYGDPYDRLNIPRVPRGLPVLQVRDRAASLRLSW